MSWHCLLHTEYVSECHACVRTKADNLVHDLRDEIKMLRETIKTMKKDIGEARYQGANHSALDHAYDLADSCSK